MKTRKPLTVLTIVAILCINLVTMGCATPQKTGQTMQAVAITAPVLAYQLDAVYDTLIKAQAVPAHQEIATNALRSLDEIAPMVASQGAALSADQFNWAALVIQAAITAVKVLGLWL